MKKHFKQMKINSFKRQKTSFKPSLFLKILGLIGKIIGLIICAILTVVLVCLITGIIVGCAFAIYVSQNIDPTVDEMLFYNSTSEQTTTIYYYNYEDAEARQNRDPNAELKVLKKIYGTENSLWASIGDIPDNLENAFIAIEDKRFRTHEGVDWRRTAGAVLNFFIGFDESSYGGSTITQQLIKNVTGEDEATIQRKVEEILRALNLEKTMEKDQILELYLNIVPLSQNCIGVRAAAETYFGKELDDLSLVECAALASITKYPTKYDPFQNPDNNKKRRNDVLYEMHDQKLITDEEYNEAINQELVLRGADDTSEVKVVDTDKINSWYVDTVIVDVREDLMEKYGISKQLASNMINSGGLSIYTLIDPKVQQAMEEVFEDENSFDDNKSGILAEAAMAVVDPYTGDLLGVVGGRGKKRGNLVLNYATQTQRAPGSSIKPISVYGPALEEGIITYGSVYDDTPLKFNGRTPYPKKLPDQYRGLTTIVSAIERSVNTVAMKVLEDLGIETSFNYMTQKLGFDYLIDYAETSDGVGYTDKGLAALALGQLNYGVTVRDMAAAYTVFPSNGVYSKCNSYLRVEDSEGNVILSNEKSSENGAQQKVKVFSEQTAYIMTKMLYNVVNSANGTAKSITLKDRVDIAGKTGTAGNDYDRWFVGYTPYYVGAAWYGYSFPKSIGDNIKNPSTKLFDLVMTKLHEDIIAEANLSNEDDIVLKTFDDNKPSDVDKVEYCIDSGKKPCRACSLDPRGDRTDVGYFARSNRPFTTCDTHIIVEYDSETNAYAHKYSKNTYEVALIRENTRAFPRQITVWDAQYVYRDLPEGVEPCGWWGDPYFIHTIPEGTYVGVSRSRDLYKVTVSGKQETRPYNMFSYANYIPPASETTTEDETTSAPPAS